MKHRVNALPVTVTAMLMPIIVINSNGNSSRNSSSNIGIADGIIPSTHTVHVLIAQIKYVYSQQPFNYTHTQTYSRIDRMAHKSKRDRIVTRIAPTKDRSICNLLFAKLSARDANFVGHRVVDEFV